MINRVYIIFFLFISQNFVHAQYAKIDSLENLLKISEVDSLRQSAYINISTIYLTKLNDIVKSDSVIKAFNEEYTTPYSTAYIDILYKLNRAVHYLIIGDADNGIKAYEKIIKKFDSQLYNTEDTRFLKLQITAHVNLATLQKLNLDFDKSIVNFEKSLELFDKFGDNPSLEQKKLLPPIYINMGAVHCDLANHKLGHENFERGKLISYEIGDSISASYSLVYSITYLLTEEQWESAQKKADELLINGNRLKNKLLITSAQYSLGEILLGKYSELDSLILESNSSYKVALLDSAQFFLKNALSGAEELKAPQMISGIKSSFADLNYLRGDWQEALDYFLENYDKRALDQKKVHSHKIVEAYKSLGDYQNALKWTDTIRLIQDSINFEIQNQKLTEYQSKYQNEKQAKQLAIQNLALESQEKLLIKEKETNSLYNTIMWIVIFFIICLLVLLFYLILSFRKQKSLSIELSRLSIAISKIENPIIIVDSNGVIEYANSSFFKSYPDLENPIGKKITSIRLSNINLERQFALTIATNSHQNYTNQLNDKWIQTTIYPIHSEEKKNKKYIFIDSDISKIKNTEIDLMKKNNQIQESIQAAVRLQNIILPTKQEFKNLTSENFVYYRPKELIGGDFYYLKESDKFQYLIVADCTGHGVSGALLSFLSSNMIDHILYLNPEISPSHLVSELNSEVYTKLNHLGESKDGLDMVVCRIEKETNILDFSAVQNPLYLVRNHVLTEYKGGKLHIGRNLELKEKPPQKTIQLEVGDLIYLFSDGLPDQKGGESGKKLFYSRFRDLLVSISSHSPPDQKKKLQSFHKEWQGNREQIDDITVVGIKF